MECNEGKRFFVSDARALLGESLDFGALEPLLRICGAWSEIIGDAALAEYSEPVSFEDDLLVVRIKNASCRFLIRQKANEISDGIRERFPDIGFRGVRFK